jgi:hypothetical protein
MACFLSLVPGRSNHDATVAGVVEAGVCGAQEQPKNSRPSSNQLLTWTGYNEHVDAARGSVLIAEDDERVRESIGRVLAYEGYDVRTAADGVEAWPLWPTRRRT